MRRKMGDKVIDCKNRSTYELTNIFKGLPDYSIPKLKLMNLRLDPDALNALCEYAKVADLTALELENVTPIAKEPQRLLCPRFKDFSSPCR